MQIIRAKLLSQPMYRAVQAVKKSELVFGFGRTYAEAIGACAKRITESACEHHYPSVSRLSRFKKCAKCACIKKD